MGFMSRLIETYDSNKHMVGVPDGNAILAPIAHKIQQAQIEITITSNGEFRGARFLDDKTVKKELNINTIIPVTEESLSKSGTNPPPHPLCDTLPYIAGDFSDYINDTEEKNKANKKFENYCKLLETWARSEYSHPKVQAVYTYIQKKQVVYNLIQYDESLLNKIHKYSNSLVRFIVLGEEPTATWQDQTLFEAYINYYRHNKKKVKKDVCYITGETAVITEKHPEGTLSFKPKAKLITGNDKENFVYRGRFCDKSEALSIGDETSYKAHNALRWLIDKQGITITKSDKRTFLCWNPKGKNILNDLDYFGFQVAQNSDANTEEIFKQKLKDAINGYRNTLDESDDIVVMTLDYTSDSTGRLSVTYYNELKKSDFYDRIEKWYGTCCWFFYNKISSPLTQSIVKYAFGTIKNSKSGVEIEINDKVMNEQYQRILTCIIEDKPVPYDLVRALALKASNPYSYKEAKDKSQYNYDNLLSTACAVIKKYHNFPINIDKGVENKMDFESKRSYIFGQLLAICEHVEDTAMYKKERSDERDTNAMRYMSAFSNRPLYTSKILWEKVQPYLTELSKASQIYYKDLTQSLFSELFELAGDEFEQKLNKPLNEVYIIGYFLKRKELRDKNNKKSEIEEEENNE